MATEIKDRIRRIQQHLGVAADGMIGVDTLTALENALFPEEQRRSSAEPCLTVSRKGLALIVQHEISSAAYYRKFLSCPVHPGGESGCTIGIGYDLGYNSASQIRRDWSPLLSERELDQLLVVAGLKGDTAKAAVRGIKHISVPLDAAEQVFYQSTLPRFAKLTLKTYPGVHKLFADAQAALLSLIYNRGSSLSGSSRREMKTIREQVSQQNYAGIAEQILAMRRLWEGRGLDGLLKRREEEARLVSECRRDYPATELVVL